MVSKLFRPKAIRLKGFIVGTVINKCKIKRLSDYALLERDDYKCQYCGAEVTRNTFTKDHVMPRSRGGKTIARNLVVCCDKCNQKKGDRTPEEAGMTLLKPVRDITHFDATRFMKAVYDELMGKLRE
jgi:CRISPR/Cas system Type II protein with McrA/HNH and RuvC-like nuclease domain